MSTSYGTITITDTTDLGQLSVYLTGSTVRQQIYDKNTDPVSYYPDWSKSGQALIITPHVYFNGSSQELTSNKIEVVWSKEEGGHSYDLPVTPKTTDCPETAAGTSGKELQRDTNLGINSTGATYIAKIIYKPIDGAPSVKLEAIATLDLTIANNGIDGGIGASAKTIQLIGSGSHFIYTYDGNPIGNQTITLTAEKSNTVDGVHWYCDNTLIKVNNAAYTELSLQLTPSNIGTYSTGYASNKSAQFKVVETNSSGTEVDGGLIDYFTVYRLEEARPGDSVYVAYLDNDEETVNEYNGQIDFTNATTTFHLLKNGVNNLTTNSGWTIAVTDSGNLTYTAAKSAANSLPGATSYDTITEVTAMTGNTGWIQFTAIKQGVADQVKRFTIVKNPSLISHALRLDSVVANRDVESYQYTPSQITADAIVRTGGGTQPYRAAGQIVATITYNDDSTATVTNAANSACIINLADKVSNSNHYAIKLITVTLNYNGDEVDSQTIAISSDGTNGTDGDSPWVFMIGNSFDSISTDFSYNSSEAFTIKIPIEAVQGVDKKAIYKGGNTYPTISATSLSYTSGTTTTIAPQYYNGNSRVTTDGSVVDNIRYPITKGTLIGPNGTMRLTLTYASGKTLIQDYSYKAQPEALKPIRVLLEPNPSDTFENQEGTITVTPSVYSGTDAVTSGWGTPTWEVYTTKNGTTDWYTIADAGITGTGVTNNVLSVQGSAVDGYLGFRFSVSINSGGISSRYTEYINLKDIDDPLQVSLHSTIGTQILNSQGTGVIYARVIRKGDTENIDAIVPDNLLQVGTAAPTTSGMGSATGYVRVNTSTGATTYYSRSSSTSGWTQRASTQATYSWTFRDADNAPISKTDNTAPAALKYAMNNNTQFVYVDSSVIKNKLTADVKVTI